MAGIRGNKTIAGSKGQLWYNGELWAEVKSFEVKATFNRETVQMAGSYDEDSKVTSISCEGTIVLSKVYSRESDFIAAFKNGNDNRFQLYSTLDDPDAFGRESVQIDNCWWNELTIMQFEAGGVCERELPFGCTFSDITYPETIQR